MTPGGIGTKSTLVDKKQSQETGPVSWIRPIYKKPKPHAVM